MGGVNTFDRKSTSSKIYHIICILGVGIGTDKHKIVHKKRKSCLCFYAVYVWKGFTQRGRDAEIIERSRRQLPLKDLAGSTRFASQCSYLAFLKKILWDFMFVWVLMAETVIDALVLLIHQDVSVCFLHDAICEPPIAWRRSLDIVLER